MENVKNSVRNVFFLCNLPKLCNYYVYIYTKFGFLHGKDEKCFGGILYFFYTLWYDYLYIGIQWRHLYEQNLRSRGIQNDDVPV